MKQFFRLMIYTDINLHEDRESFNVFFGKLQSISWQLKYTLFLRKGNWKICELTNALIMYWSRLSWCIFPKFLRLWLWHKVIWKLENFRHISVPYWNLIDVFVTAKMTKALPTNLIHNSKNMRTKYEYRIIYTLIHRNIKT